MHFFSLNIGFLDFWFQKKGYTQQRKLYLLVHCFLKLPNFINWNQTTWKCPKVVSVYNFLYENQVNKYSRLTSEIVLNSNKLYSSEIPLSNIKYSWSINVLCSLFIFPKSMGKPDFFRGYKTGKFDVNSKLFFISY